MDSNTHSTSGPDRLTALVAAVDGLTAQDLDRLTDAALADRLRVLRRQLDRQEGQWLRTLAAIDARGAAGADQGVQAPSTAGWLRARLRLSAGAGQQPGPHRPRAVPRSADRHRRGVDRRGPSRRPMPRCWPPAPRSCPPTSPLRPNRCWWTAARRLDPPRLRQAIGHLRLVADPEGAERPGRAAACSGGGCGWRPPGRAWSRSTGCWTPRPARPCWPHWTRWPAPPAPTTTAARGQRRADALAELARRNLEGGRLPQSGGVRPQLLVTVDLDSLLGPLVGWVGRPVGSGRWTPRPVGGWPVMGRSPGCWSPATGPTTPTATTPAATTTPAPPRPSGRRWQPGGAAPGGGDPAPGDPRWSPDPAAGGGPDQPGRDRRPTRRPDGPRRRLRGRGL